jgi:glucose-6-phosphate isomerase
MKLTFNTSHANKAYDDASIKEAIASFKSSERYDFINTLADKALVTSTQSIYEKFKDRKNFVQIGIGGSSLGPEMLIKAIKRTNVNFYFLNNIDTDHTIETLESFDLKDSLFYVVSKSGGTAETMALMAIVTNKLLTLGVKEDELSNYFVFCTDPVQSSLKDLGEELGIDMLTVPSNVGGRFSVLTPVGLLPALFAGVDINELVNSAKSFADEFIDSDDLINTTSAVLNLYKEGFDQTVLMPYSSKLRELSFWFVQLWAESLGKNQVGLTPVPSYGATDQHSQMQLFMEGPKNKLLFLVHVENCEKTLSLENNFNHSKLQKLNKFNLKNLMDAEFFGTLKALDEQGVPYIHMGIDKVCEKSLGELILFFEILTAISGLSLKIDPFNQPGVEAGKIYSFEWLDKSL